MMDMLQMILNVQQVYISVSFKKAACDITKKKTHLHSTRAVKKCL